MTAQKNNSENVLPNITKALSPTELLTISFNETEIVKNNINNITIEILKANITIPVSIDPSQLIITGLVKNIDLNFCTFLLESITQVYIVKTIYWNVNYSSTSSNVLYDKFLNAWNNYSGQAYKADILHNVFVGKNKLLQENFFWGSFLYSLTNDLLIDNQVYDYFKDKKTTNDVTALVAGVALNNGIMSKANKNTDIFISDVIFQIMDSNSNFITKLPYSVHYAFNQMFSLKEFTNNSKNYYEITCPIDSIRISIDITQDLSIPFPGGNWISYKVLKNSKSITFRIDPSLLGITF